ncbi:hypothetical protein [Vibrio mimicus]|uniref:hypothetical protein n=1 Tax=Vibrio mimicus TaxID=674 RepID=UPI0005B629CA|nr:hypothetical protein [Vibrio mimicus]
MRMLILSLMACFLVGCTTPSTTNIRALNKFEESFEFDIQDNEIMLRRAMDFVLDVNLREPKTKYIVMYRPEQGEFIDQFVLRMKAKGIAKYRYKLEAAPETQSKAVSILATYIQITSQDCGTLTFHNADYYPFGCSVEHNRGISLVNPLEE